MNKPEVLVLDGESQNRFGIFTTIAGFCILVVVCGIAMVSSDGTIRDMILPFGVFSAVLLIWLFGNIIVGIVRKAIDRRAINRMFGGEIWGSCQFSASEWERYVESQAQLIWKDEGIRDFIGGVYSGILGLIVSSIIALVVAFAVKDPQMKPTLWATAVFIFFLFLGAGLVQPFFGRSKAKRYRIKALRVREPRLWFASKGIYHETLGYTSLKELIKVTDQTRSRSAITFTLYYEDADSSDAIPFPVRVPASYKQEAAQLARRYRQERLS